MVAAAVGVGVGLDLVSDWADGFLVNATPNVSGPLRSLSGLNCKFSLSWSLSAQLLG